MIHWSVFFHTRGGFRWTIPLFFVAVFREASSEREAAERADDLKAYGAWAGYYLVTYLAAVVILGRGAKAQEESRP